MGKGEERGSQGFNRVGKWMWGYRYAQQRPYSDRLATFLVVNWGLIAVGELLLLASHLLWPNAWGMAGALLGLAVSVPSLKWSLEGLAYRREVRRDQAILDTLERFSL